MSQKTKRLGSVGALAEPRFNSVREDKKMNTAKHNPSSAETPDFFIALNEALTRMENLKQLLNTAVAEFEHVDFGAGQGRNHALDRVLSVVDVSRELADRLVADMDGIYSQITHRKPSEALVAPAVKLLPSNFDNWSMVDFEIAYEMIRNVGDLVSGIINQPRAMTGDADFSPRRRTESMNKLVPAADAIYDFWESNLDHPLSDMIGHLQSVRFEDESEDRRKRIITRFYLDFPDCDVPIERIVELVSNSGKASKSGRAAA